MSCRKKSNSRWQTEALAACFLARKKSMFVLHRLTPRSASLEAEKVARHEQLSVSCTYVAFSFRITLVPSV